MKQYESLEQQRLFLWWRILGHSALGLAACCLFAIPNGGKRSLKTAMQLKREGVVAGVPDVFLAAPAGGHHGLFIELKRPRRPGVSKGRPTQAQLEVMQHLQDQGYACVLAYGADEAQAAIEKYLGGQE